MRLIETNRFLLRKVETSDCNEIFQILSNPNVITNLNMNIHNSIEDTKRLLNDYFIGLKENTKFPYAIIDKNTNQFLGVFLIKLDLFDEDCFEFTIYLNEKYWGNGIYTEVLPHMVKFAFEDIGTGNFRGFVMEKNTASKKVLEKTGFKLEKIFNVDGLSGKIFSFLITKKDFINGNLPFLI